HRAWHHRVPHRARHESRHGRVAADRGPRSRGEDRRRNAGAGAQRPACDRGVPGEAALAMALLEVSKIDVFYGRVQAIRGLSISVGAGEIVALIGSNGAGQSPTLRTMSGLLHLAVGKMSFRGGEVRQSKTSEKLWLAM